MKTRQQERETRQSHVLAVKFAVPMAVIVLIPSLVGIVLANRSIGQNREVAVAQKASLVRLDAAVTDIEKLQQIQDYQQKLGDWKLCERDRVLIGLMAGVVLVVTSDKQTQASAPDLVRELRRESKTKLLSPDCGPRPQRPGGG